MVKREIVICITGKVLKSVFYTVALVLTTNLLEQFPVCNDHMFNFPITRFMHEMIQQIQTTCDQRPDICIPMGGPNTQVPLCFYSHWLEHTFDITLPLIRKQKDDLSVCEAFTYSVCLPSSCGLRVRIDAGKKNIGIDEIIAHAPNIKKPSHHAPIHLGSSS